MPLWNHLFFPTSLNTQVVSIYGYCNSQHVAASHHQPEAFDVRLVPNVVTYPNHHTLHLQNPAGGSYPILPQLKLSQPGVIAPNNFQLQDPADDSYPTLGSHLQASTMIGSAFQQVAVNHLHCGSFSAMQNALQEPPFLHNPTSFDLSPSQAAFAYDSCNSHYAAIS
jgi:hypothetical protein